MRVSMVEFSPSGGLLHFAVQLGGALARLGHDVELVTGPDPDVPSDAPLRVAPILPTWRPESSGTERAVWRRSRRVVRGVRHAEAWRRVLHHSRQTAPDVLQLGNLRFAVDGFAALQIVRHGRARIVVDVAHTPSPWAEQRASGDLHKRGRSLRRALGRAYASLDLVVVLGEASRRELYAAWPDVKRSYVMSLGADTTFEASSIPPAGDAPPTVLFFGNWNRYKGIDILLDAFELVRSQEPGARLVIAGSVGADVDLASIRGRAEAIGAIDVRPGYVPDEAVPHLFRNARVVAVPYRHANQSAIIRVAQRFERPVVASAVGDLPEAVVHGRDGLLVPPESPRPLADSLLRLLEDPEEASRMGQAGAQHSAAHASWAAIAGGLADEYEKLLARSREMTA